MGRLLLAAPALPAAAIAHASVQEPPKPSSFATCVSSTEPALTADERARLEKGIAGVEQALDAVRSFKLPPGTDPAFRFAPIVSKRRG